MPVKNVFYAQSGGVTSVINASACGVIEAARANNRIGTVYAGLDGILGALNENLIDTSLESDEAIAALKHTPGGAFGTCRYKLKTIEENQKEYERLIEVFSAHNIGYFLYNGGGDSQDTAYKVSQMGKKMNYPLTCIGIPKTVDNDLPHTDCCPGFGSAAKYLATSIREAGMDLDSMSTTSTKVFILEVMGRHAGWMAAATGLAAEKESMPPHIILFPEIALDEKRFLSKVKNCVEKHGSCAIVVSEGLKDKEGNFLADSGLRDAFGHAQLGGVAPVIAQIIKRELGYKFHYAISDYLQRSARHIASQVDVDQAYDLGRMAVEKALSGVNNKMLTIERTNANPYQWEIGTVDLSKVAAVETKVPTEYITEDGFHITGSCRDYLLPLIQGEAYPPFKDGLPNYVNLQNHLVEKKLKKFEIA